MLIQNQFRLLIANINSKQQLVTNINVNFNHPKMNVTITIPRKLQPIKVSPISQPLSRLPIPKLISSQNRTPNQPNRVAIIDQKQRIIQTKDTRIGTIQQKSNVNNHQNGKPDYNNRQLNAPNRSLSRNSNDSRQSKNAFSPKVTFKFVSPDKNKQNLPKQSASKAEINIASDSNINFSQVNQASSNFDQSSSFIQHLNPVRSSKRLIPPPPVKYINQKQDHLKSYRNQIVTSHAQESVNKIPIQTSNRIQHKESRYLEKQNSDKLNITTRQQGHPDTNENQGISSSQGYMKQTANFNVTNSPKNLNSSVNNTLDATHYSNNQNNLIALLKQLESRLQQSANEINSLKDKSQKLGNQNQTLKIIIEQKQLALQNANSLQRSVYLQNKKLQNQLKMYKIQQKQMEKQIQQLNQINSEKSEQLQKCRAFIKNLQQNMHYFRK